MNDFRVLLASALLAAGVSAAVAAGFARFAADDGPRIASVRLAGLVAAHAARAARGDGDAAETAAAARLWALSLEDALGRVAARRGAVLLPARAVAAGAPDLTGEVRAELARVMAGPPGADGGESGR